MIKYILVENSITAESESCYAIVSCPRTKDLDEIITHMIGEGSGLTRPQALAYFERLTQSVMHFAKQGYSISTPLFRTRPTISGVFDGKGDQFDAQRHQVKIRVTEGQRLREMPLAITKLAKVTHSKQLPLLFTFTDVISEKQNSTLTSRGIGMLKGKQLYFNPKDSQQGLFFVPVNDPVHKVRVTIYSGVKPSEIHFQIPELATGVYKLMALTISRSGNKILQGELEELLHVG